MEENERAEGFDSGVDVFSKSVRAGKRTYYFDVKTTKKNDYYLTITERKKRLDENGEFQIEKHKIFLYKEDFIKFYESLMQVMEFIDEATAENDLEKNLDVKSQNYTEIDFEDLDNN
jgi:hypothetical protein